MSRQQVENRLENVRWSELNKRVLSVLGLGITALLAIQDFNPSPGENRAVGVVGTIAFGAFGIGKGLSSVSDSMKAAQLEGVLAQDDLYNELIPEQQQSAIEPTQPLYDQEQI